LVVVVDGVGVAGGGRVRHDVVVSRLDTRQRREVTVVLSQSTRSQVRRHQTSTDNNHLTAQNNTQGNGAATWATGRRTFPSTDRKLSKRDANPALKALMNLYNNS